MSYRHRVADRAETVAVLTALEVEYRAVRAYLTGLRVRDHPMGTLFEEGQVPGTAGRIAIAVTGPGNPGAALLAERAITAFHPRALLFVGVAGALRDDIQLGDVVVATKVYGYHGGRDEDGNFLVRPEAWRASHRLEQLARQVARGHWWASRLTWAAQIPPVVHFRPVAAGEVVLNARDSPLAAQLRRSYSDAAAVEMESAGVAHAGHLNDCWPTLTVRGISDKADGAKDQADDAGWQRVAAARAAAFAVALAVRLLDDRELDTRSSMARRPYW